MPSITQELDRIREMAGLPPLPDPSIIQEDGAPPPPPAHDYTPPAVDPDVPAEWLDPELDTMPGRGDADDHEDSRGTSVPAPPPSPLIPRYATHAPAVPIASLLVGDRLAAWRGRTVTLTEPEEGAVRAIVLRAIQREVQADLDAVGARRTRRRRTASPKPPATPEPAPAAPAKRGRPRRVAP